MKRKKVKLADVLELWDWPHLRINFGGDLEFACPHQVGHGGTHGCDGCCSHPSFSKMLKKRKKNIWKS
jgi:hypothetical protein